MRFLHWLLHLEAAALGAPAAWTEPSAAFQCPPGLSSSARALPDGKGDLMFLGSSVKAHPLPKHQLCRSCCFPGTCASKRRQHAPSDPCLLPGDSAPSAWLTWNLAWLSLCFFIFCLFGFFCFYYYYFIFHLSILDHLLGWQEALWGGPGTACALCSFLPNLILSSCLSHPGAAAQHISYPCSETSLLLFSCLKLLLLNESACTIPCKASAVFSDAPAPAGSRSWGSGSQQ